jgi:hypothetical protein
MNTTDIAAWWGAIVATAVLSWDVVKWIKAGPRLRVLTRVNVGYPDSRVVRTEQTEAGNVHHLATYCHIEVLNVGDRPTTIISIEATHALGTNKGRTYWTGGRFQLFDRPLPTLLGPGEMWSARLEMEDLLQLAKRGRPMLRIRASHLRKEVDVFPELPEKTDYDDRLNPIATEREHCEARAH